MPAVVAKLAAIYSDNDVISAAEIELQTWSKDQKML